VAAPHWLECRGQWRDRHRGARPARAACDKTHGDDLATLQQKLRILWADGEQRCTAVGDVTGGVACRPACVETVQRQG